jgi:hypothetical protein
MSAARYEVGYEIDGQTGKDIVFADSEASYEEVLRQFHRRWEEYGDIFTGNCWVNACWSVE